MPIEVYIPTLIGLMASEPSLSPCVARHQHGATIAVRATPNAPRSLLKGLKGERLDIRLNAPPLEGKANLALIRWISKKLKVPRGDIRLLAGQKSRDKVILIENGDPRTISEAVDLLIEDI